MTTSSLKNRVILKRLTSVTLVAVLVRLAAIFAFGDRIEETVYEYDQIAHNIVAGEGFSFDMYGSNPVSPTAWMAPVYPYLLAGYYKLFGNNLTGMAVIQALAGGITCLLVGLCGSAIAGSGIGLISAVIFALYPEMILLPLKFVAESWLLLWTMLIFWLGIKYNETRKRWMIVVCGILCGVAALTRVSALAYPIGLMFWFLVKGRFSRRLLTDSALLLLLTAATIAPWTVRNCMVMDKFVLIRTNFWVNAWRGNFPGATGTARNTDKILQDLALDPEYRKIIDPMLQGDEISREETYKKLAVQHIAEDPLRYIGLSLRRLFYFWTLDPTHPMTGHLLYWLPWVLLVLLSMFGAYTARSLWYDYSFWYLLFVITTVIYSLMLVLPRYRIPLIPGLMLLAASGVHHLVRKLRWSGE